VDNQVIVQSSSSLVIRAIEQAALADSTKSKYLRAVENYLETGRDLFDATQLSEYAVMQCDSVRAFLKASIRLVSKQVERDIKNQANPQNVTAVQAMLYRLDALRNAVPTKKVKGRKMHTWLSAAEVKLLFETCDTSDLTGKRDKLLLGLLVAAGLRREEAANLTFGDVIRQANGDKVRTVLQIRGKGAKDRIVPISDRLADAIDDWSKSANITEGRILRSFDRRGNMRDSLSPQGIFQIVNAHGVQIGKIGLAPHDLRRTYAQLGYEAGIPITQISRLLGHASVATTQRYLNLDLDLNTTISDFVPF